MQTRKPIHPFSDLLNFEKEYQHQTIKKLLNDYFNDTELFSLLEYVDVSSYRNLSSICRWNKDVIQPIEAVPDLNLIDYHNLMLFAEAAPKLDQQMWFYHNIFNRLQYLSSYNFNYFLLLGKICGLLAKCYFQLGEYESAKMYQLSLLEIQIVCALLEYKMIDGEDIAESFNYLGVIFSLEKKYELSNMCYRYALTAIECMSNQQSFLIEGELHYNIGSLYLFQGGAQAFEENQEDFSEQELENRQRFLLLADDYFKISLKYGVAPEKIEPKLVMLAEASQRLENDKESVKLMEGAVNALIEDSCEKKLEQNTTAVNTERKNTADNETVDLKSSRSLIRINTSFSQNNVVYCSPQPASTTAARIARYQTNAPLLQTPFPISAVTLLPTPKSYYNGSYAFFPAGTVGSPRTYNPPSQSNHRNAEYPAAQSFSITCAKR